MTEIKTQALTPTDFAPFGDILQAVGAPDMLINQDLCERFHDHATLDFGIDGRAGISIFNAHPRSLPYQLDMMERHPEGSQAFIPMSEHPFLIIVASDDGDRPGLPKAFISDGTQAINFHRNTWHGVLTPLHAPGVFAVIDRIGKTPNLQEYWFQSQYVIIF